MNRLRRSVIIASSPAVQTAHRARSRRPDASALAATCLPAAQRRHASTHRLADTSDEIAGTSSRQQPSFGSPLPRTSDVIDYANNLPVALRTRDVDAVVRCMVAGAHDAAFVCSIPPVTFTEILRLISSSCGLDDVQQALDHSWWLRRPALFSLKKSLVKLLHAAPVMAASRRRSNLPLSLLDYKLLLQCAAPIADKSTAKNAWRGLEADGLKPDVDCYNTLIHTILWDRHLPPKAVGEDGRLVGWTNPLSFRVDRFYLSARRMRKLSYAPPLGGYEVQVRGLIDELLKQGSLTNETTILHLITAFAREGNVMSVKDTLRLVWNIHVDELMDSGHQLSPPKRFPSSAPLHPTVRLLYTVAHAFGANSELPTALRVADFISSSYDLPLPHQVWSELLTWTYVQSSLRFGRFRRMHVIPNQLPSDAPEKLWQTLVGQPYNVRPTMKMFHLSINNLTKLQRYDIVEQRIDEGVRLFRENCATARAAERQLRQAQRDLDEGRSPPHPLSALQRTRDAKVAAVKRDRGFIRRWCQMYIVRGNGNGLTRQVMEEDGQVYQKTDPMYDIYPEWAECDVPTFVRKFRAFCPRVVKYRTPTGAVELDLQSSTNGNGEYGTESDGRWEGSMELPTGVNEPWIEGEDYLVPEEYCAYSKLDRDPQPDRPYQEPW